MSETRGSGGLGWVWLLLAYMVMIGAFVAAVAYLFPNGIHFSQAAAETAPTQEVVPVEEDAVEVELEEVMSDPSRFFDKNIVAVVRVTDIVTDRILWLGGVSYYSQEFFAVVARGIDLKASDFRIWQLVKLFGTVRPFEEEELKSQGLVIGRRISGAMRSEKGYLLIQGLIPSNPDPRWLLERDKALQAQEELEQALDEEPDQSLDEESDQTLVQESDQVLDQQSDEEQDQVLDQQSGQEAKQEQSQKPSQRLYQIPID